MNRLILASLALIATTGCGPFVPTAGDYTLSSMTLSENGCGLDDPEGEEVEEESFELSVNEEDLTVSLDFGEDFLFDCALDGQALSCDDYVIEQDGDGYEIDQTFQIGGDFADEVTLSGAYGITMSCEGEKCAEVEEGAEITLPCTSTVDFTAATTAAE